MPYPKDSIFILCSDDPLLKQDRTTELLAKARQRLQSAGNLMLYTQSDLASAASDMSLASLENSMADPGLLGGLGGSERIIKINLVNFDDTAIETFKVIASCIREGVFVIVDMPRVNTSLTKVPAKDPQELLPQFADPRTIEESSAKKKAKAKKGRAKVGDSARKEAMSYLLGANASIEHMYTPTGAALLGFIQRRAGKYGLLFSPKAIELIASGCDNNLMSIDQSMRVLELTYASKNIELGVKEVAAYFTQDARYSGFELPMAILNNDSEKALNILRSSCSDAGNSLASGLELMLRTMDSCLTTLYTGKEQLIHRKPDSERRAFFLKNGIKIYDMQSAILRAIERMKLSHLDYLNQCLAEATRLHAQFDNEGAYRALQRMAIANKVKHSEREANKAECLLGAELLK